MGGGGTMERTTVDTVMEEDTEAGAPQAPERQLSRGLLSAFRFLALGVIFAALLHDVFTLLDQRNLFLADLASYYVPARALGQFPSINPYDLDALRQLNASAHLISHSFFWFVYPPITLLLLRPLTALPFMAAGHIWTLFSHLFAIATAILFADAFAYIVRKKWQAQGAGATRDRMLDQVYAIVNGASFQIGRWTFPTLPIAVSLAVLLFAYPTSSTYAYGQINLVVLFFLILGLHAHLYNRPILAGVSVAIAGGLKLSPLFVLAFFLVRGAWKALFWSLGLSVVLFAIPLVLISPNVLGQFSAALASFDATIVPVYLHNESLPGVFIQVAAILHTSPKPLQQIAEVLGALLAVVGVGALVVLSALRSELLWWRSLRHPDRLDLDWLAFAFVLVAYLLATPIVWAHYYVVVIPALLALGAFPLLRQRVPGESWTATDSLVMLGAAVGLALITSQLPLGVDHSDPLASPTLALLLRSLRVLGLFIAWALSAVIVTPMLRRAWNSRATILGKASGSRSNNAL